MPKLKEVFTFTQPRYLRKR